MIEGNDNSIDLGRYVLGLKDSVLRAATEAACGSSVASFRSEIISREWPEYGCQGEKCVLCVSYKTEDQGDGKADIFVKKQEGDPGLRETPHYQYLNQQQLPVPRIYGSLLDEQQMEVLLLEDVQPNIEGDRLLDSPDHLRAFLSLAARINALRPEGEYGRKLFYFGWDTSIARGIRTLDAIWNSAASGRLGAALTGLCSTSRRDALLSLAESLAIDVPAMERGYAHNEYTGVQVGWRRETGEMLVFDLRTTGLGPRFVDVAPWLGVPDQVLQSGHTPTELANYYLMKYLDAGGVPVAKKILMSETRLLWQAGVLAGLNWWHDHALTGIESWTDKDKGRSMCQQRLEKDLTHLLETLPEDTKG